ncbi:hypothetical protein T4D_2966 [Trichinella pseudospiralis]|uniref:Uncharacterized protein n=1 Tax=Trichinella pseudospiralis TaxID=6337 RepID=A0A0V1F8C6_TRIPS|nr:hypothetical protein T4D_2966 [Trichinella pseudospiralis]
MKGEATKKFVELAKKLDRTKRRVNDLMTEIQHRCAENVEIEKTEAIVAEMDRIYSLAEDLQWSYEELLNEDDLAMKVQEWNAFHYAVVDTRVTFYVYKEKIVKSSMTENAQRKAAGEEGKKRCSLRIPKWQLAPFDGDIMQFGAFWHQFQASVHSRTDLNDIEKFICLRSNLKGPALEVISGFSITATNYPEAVKTLQERFDRTDLIIQHHIIQLAELKKLTESSSTGLRNLYDKLMLHFRALRAMGKDAINGQVTTAEIFLALSQRAMPSELNEKWEEFNDQMPAYQRIWRIDIEEKVTFTKGTKSTGVKKAQQPSTEIDLKEYPFLASDVEERWRVAKRLRLCHSCLKKGHRKIECSASRKTATGETTIHDLLKRKGAGDKKIDEKTEENITKVCLKMSVDKRDGSSSYSNSSLQIARAVICAENGIKRTANCILDSGAQRSFVRKEVVESLGLNGPKEHITISSFNQLNEHRKLMLVELRLKGVDNDNFCVINALCVSHLCGIVPPNPVMEEHDHLKGLKLADQFPRGEVEIDLLIGIDHYYDIVLNEIKKGGYIETDSSENDIWLGHLWKKRSPESNTSFTL